MHKKHVNYYYISFTFNKLQIPLVFFILFLDRQRPSEAEPNVGTDAQRLCVQLDSSETERERARRDA